MQEISLPGFPRLAAALVCVFLFVYIPVFATTPPTISGTDIVTPSAMVVCADSIASEVGNQILLEGGNAVDAAVAVGFALAVTLPRAGNIGGGGLMLIRLADGEEKFIDYRERAPSRASRDMYLDAEANVIPGLSTRGHLATGVPGTVYGLAYAHKAFGTLPWERLVDPAVLLARKGFVVSPSLAASIKTRRAHLEKFEESRRIFVAPGYQAGDRLVQLDLAATLERIAADWRDFYTGETAKLIVEEMRRGGGLITMEDLAAYHPVPRQPLRFRYRDLEITSAPLPSSGGIILAQVLQMLDSHKEWRFEQGSTGYVHLLSELEKIAYRSRALYLGDLDFYASPWEQLISRETTDDLALLVSPQKILKVSKLESKNMLGGATVVGSEETTHFSIVDQWGNAVANTYTLNGSFGSGVVVKGAGFLLNNEMDDFSVKPGVPNLYGLVGSEANAIEPGKRMLSSMTPTFVYKNEELFLVLGTPGGSTIPTSVLQVILNVVDHGMSLHDAVSAKRFHEQYLPDYIFIENGALDAAVIDGLLEMGHGLQIRRPIGNVQAILIENGRLHGASDPRGSGRATGH
jgi:gamma-glutamyltranspeptidase/glutathione hydrolase